MVIRLAASRIAWRASCPLAESFLAPRGLSKEQCDSKESERRVRIEGICTLLALSCLPFLPSFSFSIFTHTITQAGSLPQFLSALVSKLPLLDRVQIMRHCWMKGLAKVRSAVCWSLLILNDFFSFFFQKKWVVAHAGCGWLHMQGCRLVSI